MDTRRNLKLVLALRRAARKTWELVVFPYGFYYRNNDPWSLAALQPAAKIAAPKVFFLENEYRVLKDKLAMASVLRADLVVSQFSQDVAEKAYRPFFPRDRILSLPPALHAGFFDRLPPEFRAQPRDIDLDMTGDPYPYYLGHRDRDLLAEVVQDIAPKYGLRVNVRIGDGARLPRMDWIRHLHRCKGVVGHEAGT
ncbi:MAG: hypothetical protein ACT4PT_01725, partial [Methanobacteriota archaeon]